MPHRVLLVLLTFLSIAIGGCSGNRTDIAESALDRTLYPADTKAERLLRYFEAQALMVRFAAETGAGTTERNAMALANVTATTQLNKLAECLQVGSLNMEQNFKNTHELFHTQSTDPAFLSLFVRNDNAYCSFFESRLLSYQDALFAMLRQAAHDDATAQLLSESLTGVSPLNFTNFVTTLVRAATSVYRDERVLRAFTADALELEYLIWQSPGSSPDTIFSSICPSTTTPCDDTTLMYPERAHTNLDDLRSQLGTGPGRPEIRVWHFQEVYAFMIAACQSLNGDAPAMPDLAGKAANQTRCSARMQFPFPLIRDMRSLPPPVAPKPEPGPMPSPGPGPKPPVQPPQPTKEELDLKAVCVDLARHEADRDHENALVATLTGQAKADAQNQVDNFDKVILPQDRKQRDNLAVMVGKNFCPDPPANSQPK